MLKYSKNNHLQGYNYKKTGYLQKKMHLTCFFFVKYLDIKNLFLNLLDLILYKGLKKRENEVKKD